MTPLEADAFGICAVFHVLDFELLKKSSSNPVSLHKLARLLNLQAICSELNSRPTVRLFANDFFQRSGSTIICDQIILAYSFPKPGSSSHMGDNVVATVAFLEVCQRLFTRFFAEGILLEGTINAGHVELDKGRGHFAGKALQEAMQTAGQQNWIGALLGTSAIQFLRENVEPSSHHLAPVVLSFLEDYRIPCQVKNERSLALNWAFPKNKGIEPLQGNCREELFKAALRYSPQISSGTLERINNTEPFLIYCKQQAELLFADLPIFPNSESASFARKNQLPVISNRVVAQN